MEQYIFIRDYDHKDEEGDVVFTIQRGVKLFEKEGYGFGMKVKGSPGIDFQKIADEIAPELSIVLLKLDADLFKTAFQSFGYANWLKEKASDIDERGDPLYPTLTRTPETLIMYLKELGISSDTLMRYIYGPENRYLEYRYLVQEFGKML